MSKVAGTLHMFCGKIASGKSTLAAALANSPGTILLSEDELLSSLYPGEINSLEDYARCARRLRSALGPHVDQVLRAGLTLVLDFQANTPEFRKWGHEVAQTAGADHKLHFLLADNELCKQRLAVGVMRALLAAARDAGCSALLFTVDMPVAGTRYRDYRTGFAGDAPWLGTLRRLMQGAARPAWAWEVSIRGRPLELGNLAQVIGNGRSSYDPFAWIGENFDPSVTWKDIEFIRAEWKGPLIIKGILDPMDAREAAAVGASGIVVSNHGGRQLDGVKSTAAALPPIVDAVGDRLTILADGGVRSGLDVVRMLALGARGVLLGRAWAFALAGAGGKGVRQVVELIEAEMRVAMALTGVTRIDQISRSTLTRGETLVLGAAQ